MQLLSELVGRKVTVFSKQGETERQDVGTLEAAEGHWFKLRKAESDVMYFCVYQIRLLKPFEP